jgi:solute carrier family 25 2-oxodicarboxylate transporter 21
MYPIDVTRAKVMSNPGKHSPVSAFNSFLSKHGMIGFVKKGMLTEVAGSSMARGMKFYMQPIIHQRVFGKDADLGTPLTKSFSGFLAVFPEILAISPLENVKIAQQLDKKKRFKGSADVIRHLVKTRGVFGGLYVGYFGMQLRQCLWTGGFFLALDFNKDQIRSTGYVTNNLAVVSLSPLWHLLSTLSALALCHLTSAPCSLCSSSYPLWS